MVRIIMRALSLLSRIRGIAQSGSAPALGAGCREFESLYPDQICSAWLARLILRVGDENPEFDPIVDGLERLQGGPQGQTGSAE